MKTSSALRPRASVEPSEAAAELLRRRRARVDPEYFIDQYCWIDQSAIAEDGQETAEQIEKAGQWARFILWPDQRKILKAFQSAKRVIFLKARQLGFTWIVVALALWLMVSRPGSVILIFSKDDRLAKDTLRRLKGMFARLPAGMRPAVVKNDAHEWELANGSKALSFSTEGGRGYTGTLALIDEADYQDLASRMADIKPTVDAGGKLIVGSTVDKDKPESAFKKLYRAARTGLNRFTPLFMPWSARPDRTPEWYEQEKAECHANTGEFDKVFQEYPATEDEALAPNSLDKRIPYAWLQQCYQPADPWTDEQLRFELPKHGIVMPPAIPGLRIYRPPTLGRMEKRWIPGRKYVCGADPAQGNPTSDDSSAMWFDAETGEQVAELSARLDMREFADYIHQVSFWYNEAAIMVLRNNHGHAVIMWLVQNSQLRLLGYGDGKAGWVESTLGNAKMYDETASAFRNKEVLIHSFETLMQLSYIEGATLAAPEGQHDDRADAVAAGIVGMARLSREQSGSDGNEAFAVGKRPLIGGRPEE